MMIARKKCLLAVASFPGVVRAFASPGFVSSYHTLPNVCSIQIQSGFKIAFKFSQPRLNLASRV